MDTTIKSPNRLKSVRETKRITQQHLATETGQSLAAVNRHEAGTRRMNSDVLRQYSKILEVEVVEIFVEPA